ncbi:CCA tRNA nucleotidyltransferase [Lacticaseibacillus rhamnosus]|uniref:CCA tRNA nucleotidyltransferase n=1 Tax=Lacticaseibacillus rhamnosus TaxID=47715 RepID=UPI0022E6C6C6|nr:CCA tRNA nucleotidyltransferase [Lacticaseibacillus rhamnosus]
MQLDLNQPDFKAAIPILKKIEAAGYEAYFVGGSVRDALLGLPIHDVDIASSAYPEEIKRIFKRTVDTGIEHGTVMVLDHGTGYEVTTFRTESAYQDFRRPDHVTFVRSLAEDLKRRDFTINALAVRHDGTIIDLFDGLTDLKNRQLRAVGDPHERFHEDALRMMRAVRFESQLGFHIEATTKAAIAANASLLKHISVERIAAEFNRLLVGIDRRAGMQDFLDTRLFVYAPKLAPHQAALQQFSELPNQAFTSIASGWTALIFMLKVAPESFLPAWKQSNDLMGLVDQAVTLLRKMPTPTAWDLYSAGSAAVAVVSEVAALMDHQFVPASLTTAYEALPIHSKKTLALTGRDLIKAGVRPGPAMGKILHQIEYRVVDGSLPNDSKKLLAAAIEMSREPS